MTYQDSIPINKCALFLDIDGTLTPLTRALSEVEFRFRQGCDRGQRLFHGVSNLPPKHGN